MIRKLALSNFVNGYYQYRDVCALPHVRRVMLVGIGTGLEPTVLRWAGYEVVTADIDESLRPDHCVSIDDLSAFRDSSFDVLVASHVLEHLPWSRFEVCLREIARIARWAVIYLPVAGAVWGVRLTSTAPAISTGAALNLASPFRRPEEARPRFMDANHYWEIGRPGVGLRRVRGEICRHFAIEHEYRNLDWPHSHNFVCRSLAVPPLGVVQS